MSYILYIWENTPPHTLPETIAGAARCVGELRQTKPGVNPKFVALAENLMAWYPALYDLPAGEDGEPSDEYAWTDGRINGHTEESVLNLGLSTSKVDEVRPFVVQEVVKQGLCVIDPQAGEAFLSDGRVLSLPRKEGGLASSAIKKPELPKTRELLRLVGERLAPMLNDSGFKYRKSKFLFRREFDDGWQELSLDSAAERWPIHCEFSVTATVRLHAVSELADTIRFPDKVRDLYENNSYGDNATCVAIQSRWARRIAPQPFVDPVSRQYEVTGVSQIEPLIEHLRNQARDLLLPLMFKCETIDGIDQVLNPSTERIFHANSSSGACVISAFLAHNPRLQEICDEEGRIARVNREEGVLRCIDYVKLHSA